MIYVITFSEKIFDSHPPVGQLFETATENRKEAESLYSQLLLNETCCFKALWQIDHNGVRKQLMAEEYGSTKKVNDI